jgi:ABC-type histidine transport system ATPase subunit
VGDLASEATTMVAVTHKMDVAIQVSVHVIFVDHELMVAEGSPAKRFHALRCQRLRQFLKSSIDRNALLDAGGPQEVENVAP